MSGLRVGHEALLERGLRLPGLSRRATALSQLPPLGLLTLAGLVPDDWDVGLVLDDGVVEEATAVDQILSAGEHGASENGQPDLVAFSALTPSADRACRLSERLRKRGITTIIGGLHATAAPDHCQPHFDVVVRGDGEPSFERLLIDFRGDRMQPEYQSRGHYSLSDSPMPRWDLLGDHAPPRYTVQSMRGCPWSCSFCAASRLLGPARVKPDVLFERELAAITSRQSRPWIELADDNTFASDRDHSWMLDALQRHGARWFTESDWRIALRPKLLRQIAESGCRQILVGLESNVFRYPGMGAKTADWDRMMEAVLAIQDAGIVVNGCFIVGAEGETPASIERLGDFLDEAPLGEVQLTLQTPFPGIGLYQSLLKAGRLLPGDFARYTLFDVVYQPDQMTAVQLQDSFDELVGRVYRPEAQSRRDQIQKSIRSKRPRRKVSP
ncbi:B12-binding domain-containing radical SAM protein [Rhodopirellula sp. JC740]|uniref:B12-binding domain-containing radical SAM protein n=1 Tax=Rhodopirellula halodulae TaxID=2894198 RepID=A0ABS8NLF1_9BACT|nr:radical SAM protein [Rhodopirellula sp. JC740]MCC9644388.1 B12-binding domain-containing radical SAM protein [Rhodopirellula sp. JC740]